VVDQIRLELWERLDRDMRALIADTRLSPDCACEAGQYLDHSEFALAWETLDACLRDADPATRARVREIELLLYPPDLGW
jgi:hypothetical protein